MKVERFAAVVDSHTGGEPTRIVIGGAPILQGKTMAERWDEFFSKHMSFVHLIMREPRGHGDMFGAVLFPPVTEEAAFGVIFTNPAGGENMCGHASIGVARTLVELGIVEKREPFTPIYLDTPAGQVRLEVAVENGEVGDVTLQNVPAFVFARDVEITLPSTGQRVRLDICFGGNFFAIVSADQFDLKLVPEESSYLSPLGIEIRDEVNRQVAVQHPVEKHITEVALTEFSLERPGSPTRNCVVFGDGSIDRSPCGTGTCAKMALLAAEGKLDPGQEFVHESIVGSVFHGRYRPGPKVGPFDSVLPEIRGRSYITGFNFLLKQENDELGDGFFLGRTGPVTHR